MLKLFVCSCLMYGNIRSKKNTICANLYIYTFLILSVILQKYDIHLSDEYVIRGNMAVLRCPIPSFVQDYVQVISWERVDGFLITPGIISGNFQVLVFIFYYLLVFDILLFTRVVLLIRLTTFYETCF